MLYLAIPAQNEVETIGVLLWRLRTVLAEFPREYEVVVFDDASEDETADVAEQYAHAMPVTVLRGAKPVGYAGAVDALVRYVAGHTRYPRRDAMLLLQGDFTDPPGIVPEFARRFEGGADIVIGERTAVVDAPKVVTRLFSAAGWALRPFVKIDGVRDLTSSMRLVRISVLRDLLRAIGETPVCAGDSWTANADLLLHLVPHARRVESVPMEPTYGVRMRETRRVIVRDALAALRWGWRARGRRAVPSTVPETSADAVARPVHGAPQPKRRDEPEMTAERLRERKKDRDRPRTDSGLEDAEEQARRDRGRNRERRPATDATNQTSASNEARETERATPNAAAPDRSPAVADARPPREPRAPSDERGRKRGAPGEARTDAKPERTAEPRREPRRPRDADRTAGAEDILDDPFASPSRAQSSRRANTGSDIGANPATTAGTEAPYANESATPSKRESPRPDIGAAAGNVVDGEGDDDDLNETDDASSDDGSADESGAVDSTDAGARARKRRRNRRSRRRKSRDGATDATADATTDGPAHGGTDAGSEPDGSSNGAGDRHLLAHDDSVNDGAPDRADSQDGDQPKADSRRGPRGRMRRERTAERDGSIDAPGSAGAREQAPELYAGANDDPDATTGDDASSDDDGSAQSRAKRRGRRGRRGGARRSRNRERGGADGDGGENSVPDAGHSDGSDVAN